MRSPSIGPESSVVAVPTAYRRGMTRCDPDVGGWHGTPRFSEGGWMTNVDRFVAFVEDVDPCWRYVPVACALAVLGIDAWAVGAPGTGGLRIDLADGAGSAEVSVRVTPHQHGQDDSVAAVRYTFVLVDEGASGGKPRRFRLLSGLREVRCQPGRGHRRWAARPCV